MPKPFPRIPSEGTQFTSGRRSDHNGLRSVALFYSEINAFERADAEKSHRRLPLFSGVQISYLAIIGAQLFMIALSITLLFGIFKVRPHTAEVHQIKKAFT